MQALRTEWKAIDRRIGVDFSTVLRYRDDKITEEIRREICVVEQTYYRWRKQYGGMGTDQLRELKRLQKENDRLRRAVSDLTLDKVILTEAARGRHLKPLASSCLY